jgi:hypothetical protein
VDKIIKRINIPITINKKANELYKIIKKNDTSPKDITDFLIELGPHFSININKKSTEKIINYCVDKPPPK